MAPPGGHQSELQASKSVTEYLSFNARAQDLGPSPAQHGSTVLLLLLLITISFISLWMGPWLPDKQSVESYHPPLSSTSAHLGGVFWHRRASSLHGGWRWTIWWTGGGGHTPSPLEVVRQIRQTSVLLFTLTSPVTVWDVSGSGLDPWTASVPPTSWGIPVLFEPLPPGKRGSDHQAKAQLRPRSCEAQELKTLAHMGPCSHRFAGEPELCVYMEDLHF